MLNLADPSAAFRWWRLPADGVGLARMEFVVNSAVRVHPMALVRYDSLKDEGVRAEIAELTRGYDDKRDYFVETLARAAVAVGVAGLFIETHEDPDNAPSDGPNMVPLDRMPELLRRLKALDDLTKGF